MGNKEKILKYVIWAGLILIPFIPLLIGKSYFFPFIVPKSIAFRVIVEIIFLALLGLAILKKEYRPKLNLVTLLFSLYLIVVFVSSLINDSLYFSFWSNNERSEGLLLLLHLFALLIVLNSFLKTVKQWLIIFEASFLSSLLVSLIALGQYFNVEWILKSTGGERLVSHIGNAGYVAGYLIFNIFFGLLLFFFRKNKYLRWYYILSILLQIFIVLNTLTRGGIIALAFALTSFVVYLVFFFYKKNKLVRNSGLAVLLVGLIFTTFVFINKEANWVQDNVVLQRLTTISIEATTAQNRLMTWQSAWQGFKEKPILGYGYENFYQPFDKHFNPKIFRHSGSVIWFDRAHNIIFDRLITGGIIGLALYLALLFLPLYYIWRYYKKCQEKSKYLIPVIFTLAILAYFIQNLFIFEALVTYIPLVLILAFLAQFCPVIKSKPLQSKKTYLVLLTMGIVLLIPLLYTVNIKPATTNRAFVAALIDYQTGNYQKAYDQFIDVIDRNSFGNQEYRQHFSEMVSRAVNTQGVDVKWLNEAVPKAEQELDKQIEEKPKSVRNYLMQMRFLNRAYNLDVKRLEKAIELFEKAKDLAPKRQHIYIEVAYAQANLGKYLKTLEEEKALELYNQAIANVQIAVDLNDRVIESNIHMVTILILVNKSELAIDYLKMLDENEINYHKEDNLQRLASAAIDVEDYQMATRLYEELIELVPNKVEHLINLAVTYAHLGQNDKAIATAEKVKEIDDSYTSQVDGFIQSILDGFYDK